jgi:hypothetical protein
LILILIWTQGLQRSNEEEAEVAQLIEGGKRAGVALKNGEGGGAGAGAVSVNATTVKWNRKGIPERQNQISNLRTWKTLTKKLGSQAKNRGLKAPM